jgi:hypothetical protein
LQLLLLLKHNALSHVGGQVCGHRHRPLAEEAHVTQLHAHLRYEVMVAHHTRVRKVFHTFDPELEQARGEGLEALLAQKRFHRHLLHFARH